MANDFWRTPQEVFGTLNKEFNFIADMASTHKNALCDIHFTEDEDSLSLAWKYEIEMALGHDLPNGNNYV